MDPPKYVPPHQRKGATTSAAVFHSEPWNPQREALLSWVKLGGWKTGGQFVPKLKGKKGKNPYYTVFYENAIKRPTDGKTFHVCLNIHVFGEAGGVWISDVNESFFELRNEPDTPCGEIERLWGQTAKDTYVKKT
jgi:hypothetical protein